MANYTSEAVAVEALRDRSTSSGDLARIAILHPSLLPQIAAHPNADPELLAQVMKNIRNEPEPAPPEQDDTEASPSDVWHQPDEDVPAQAPRDNRVALALVALFVVLVIVVMVAATRTGAGGGMSQKQFERLVNVEWAVPFGDTPTMSTTVGGCLPSARVQANTELGTLYLASSADALSRDSETYWQCAHIISITDYVGGYTAYYGEVRMRIDSWKPIILVPELQKDDPNDDFILLMYKNVGLALRSSTRSQADAIAGRFKQAVDAAMQ